MTESEYRAYDALNYSLLKEFKNSPDNAFYAMSKEQKFSEATLKAFKIGHGFEYMMYPGMAGKVVAVPEEINRRTKKGKEEYSSFPP